MNFVSIKTQDRSASRAAGSTVPSATPGGPADHAEPVASSRSTSNRSLPEGEEEVVCPAPQVPQSVSRASKVLTVSPFIDLSGSYAADPPILPTSGSGLLSKRSRTDTEGFGLIGLSVGDDVPAITRFLRESCNVSGPRPQLVDPHAKFVNHVAEVRIRILSNDFQVL